jgi:hypothetical protein
MPSLSLALKYVLISAGLALSVTPFVANPSQAAIRDYTFDVFIDSGPLANNSYTGSLSFDDADSPAFLSDFQFNFEGQEYNELDDPLAVAVLDGLDFLGVSYNVESPPLFSFVPGFFDVNDSLFAYDLQPSAPDQGGFGTVAYTRIPSGSTAVPGPLPVMGAAAFFGYSRKLRQRYSNLK